MPEKAPGQTLAQAVRRPSAPTPVPGASALVHHLVHRPNTPEGVVLGTTGPTTQQFAVSALLPERHSLFNDGTDLFHDLHSPAEVLRRTALFVSHRYFRVPQERPAVFAATEVAMTGLEPWRRTSGPAHLAMDITLTPADVVSGVPRGLECESTIHIEGTRCGTANARLVFLMPRVYQNHRERGRAMSRSEFTGPTEGELWAGSPTARAVGRADQVNVVLGTPLLTTESELVVEIVTDPRNQVFAEATTDHVPPVVLVEGTRQAALLLAGELHGFTVGSCVLSRWNARFQGFAEPDLPLYCRATAAELERAADGRPALPVALTLHQGSRQIAAVDTVVLQDY